MKYRLDTTIKASEITALIANAVDYSKNAHFGKGANDKSFLGVAKPDGFVLAMNDRNSLVHFKVAVRESKDGIPELYIHFVPGLIHLVGALLLLIIIIRTDHRIPVFNLFEFKLLFCIIISAVVVVKNIVEFFNIKNELIDMIMKNER